MLYAYRALFPGTVSYLHFDQGEYVEAKDVVLQVEAMKVFNPVKTDVSGTVDFRVNLGQYVDVDELLFMIDDEGKPNG